MSRSLEEYHRDVIAGRERGLAAGLLRGALGVAEPVYGGVVWLRNSMFASLRKPVQVDRPVISIGNITTGGTGKTPVVRWLAQRLIAMGHRPAVLLRGYRGGDEQRMLQSLLPGVVVHADPSRVEGARRVLKENAHVTLFLLDDGFQHRQIARDLDIVLIDAGNPFGFGHVLPRGLLREPLGGLARASALLVTHYEESVMPTIEPILRRYNPQAPILRCQHVHSSIRSESGVSHSVDALAGARVLTACAIGNPAGFEDQLRRHGATVVEAIRYPDHHQYQLSDIHALHKRAQLAAASMIVTTEKDWVKIEPLLSGTDRPVTWFRTQLEIRFEGEDEARLLELVTAVLKPSSAHAEAATR